MTIPEVSAVRDADRIIGLLAANEVEYVRLIINRIRPDLVKRGDMMNVEDTLEILSVDLIGIVPEDESIIRSSNLGEPVVMSGKSPAGAAYSNIVRRILGESVPFLDISHEGGFMNRLKHLFSK